MIIGTASSAIAYFISASTVDYKITLDGVNITNALNNPVICYDNRTYLSVRDIAKVFKKDVSWDSEKKEVIMTDSNIDKHVIWDNDTALIIGKAIICQFFPNEVNDKTIYDVSLIQADHVGAKPIFEVTVAFNDSIIDEHNIDVVVRLDPCTGAVISISKYIDRQLVFLFPWEMAK